MPEFFDTLVNIQKNLEANQYIAVTCCNGEHKIRIYPDDEVLQKGCFLEIQKKQACLVNINNINFLSVREES